MKKLISLAFAITTISPLFVTGQCSYNNTIYLSGAAPTTVGSTISAPQTWAGEFNRVTGMQAGYTYEVATCGSTTFDSEITIFTAGGGTWVAYDDDGCGFTGGSSKILFTPTVTGDYDIQLNEYPCASNSIDMTMDITLISTGGSTGASLNIPVVVHVVYKNNTENISDSQILSQINVLNADFRKLNADFGQTPSVFQGAGADMDIEFCLATVDPNGNATTGITRTSTSTQSFSQALEPKFSANGGIENWDPHHYLNMWVCDLDGSLLGYATFPADLAPEPELDGVVIDYAYFGSMGTATAPYDKGRTATHEVGHWLNLRHIWGDNFCGDDFVNDTPTQQESNGGCPSFPHVSCSNGPDGDMFMNFMDYTEDACMFMFTNGQKGRVDATFANIRTQMANSGGCGTTGLNDHPEVSEVRMYPNPAQSQFTIETFNNMIIDQVEILDVSGRLVIRENPAASFSNLNVTELRAGTYFVKITTEENYIQKKLMIVK